MKIRAVKIRAGLYRLEGKDCRELCQCGGELWVERLAADRQFQWETYCRKCKSCDPNGWSSLKKCIENSPGYFSNKRSLT